MNTDNPHEQSMRIGSLRCFQLVRCFMWTRDQKIALFSAIAAVISIIVSIYQKEIRIALSADPSPTPTLALLVPQTSPTIKSAPSIQSQYNPTTSKDQTGQNIHKNPTPNLLAKSERNEIHSIRMIQEGFRSFKLDVEYTYLGDQGEAKLYASLGFDFQKDSQHGSSISQEAYNLSIRNLFTILHPVPIYTGRNRVNVLVSYDSNRKEDRREYPIKSIDACMRTGEGINSTDFACKRWSYNSLRLYTK